MLRKALIPILLLLIATSSSIPVAAQTGRLVFSKQSPEATAEHLVNDRKFGGSSAKYAIEYGDQIIPLIKSESDNFKKLDNRNSFWIANVLGSIDSELARNTSKELYARDDSLPKLVGAIGMCMHGMDVGPINEDAFLVKIIRGKITSPARVGGITGIGGLSGLDGEDTDSKELAVIALGYSKSEDALPVLHALLSSNCKSLFFK